MNNNYNKINEIQEQKEIELKSKKIKVKFIKCEEDQIEGLNLYQYEQYIDAIFPRNFNNSDKREIIEELKQYKNIQIGSTNSFTRKIQNLDSNLLFLFILIIKRISDYEVNIHYKFILYEIENGPDNDYKYSQNNNTSYNSIKLKEVKKRNKSKCDCC